MSNKNASTTSLFSTNTSSSNWSAATKTLGKISQILATAPPKSKESQSNTLQGRGGAMSSSSQFAKSAKKNGWAAPTPTRPTLG
ncbi:hypothetical protein E4T56_gene15946 [Termitomyces sp. T112]|nr:hypothetical protein E4T56_gene15946 [Termitomyces sp. T112]